MPNVSKKTAVIMTRVDIDVYNIMLRRVEKHTEWGSVNRYAREQLEFIVRRKHGKGER